LPTIISVFRTNTAYRRWDEARKNWGMNINHTRDLVRMANTYYDSTGVPPEERQQDLQHVALCTWAFVRAMKRHLSPEGEDEEAFREELFEKLPPLQAQKIIDAAHRPNRALQDLSYAIDNLPMHFMRKNEIQQAVTIFEDDLGSSERLLTSPVPLFYSRHTARYLFVWLLLLPFILYEPFASSWNHITVIPATTILSVFLFGIDEISTQLEEPFTILPMQAFCDKIYNWCNEIVTWSPGDNDMRVRPVKPEHAYFVGAVMSPTSTPNTGGVQVQDVLPGPAESAGAVNVLSFEEFLKRRGT
jgi:predicted membrane chloride channel (bestrophin family)